MVRRIAITLVVCSVVLVAASVGLAMSQRDDARAAQDGALAHEAAQERAAIEAYFDRARAIILLTSRNPAFARFYADPRVRAAKIRDGGRTLRQAQAALAYLERLYPDSIGEACFVDRGGAENARIVRGVAAAPADLSPDESHNPFFGPTLALGAGKVFQARPYVSDDTREWVISNSTVVPGTSRPHGFVHFEVTVESFRVAAAASQRRFRVDVIDRRSGAIVLDSATRQVAGAPLGLPRDRRYAALQDTRTTRGATSVGRRRVAWDRVRGGAGNANDWIVVVTSRTAAPTLVGSFGTGPLAILVGGLLLAGVALLGGRTRALRHEADTDHLTGLANRRAFLRRLDAALRRAARDERPVALLMIDLDHFKELNDAVGHHAGDLLLQQFGPRLRAAAGGADTIARLGGDEFAVILAGRDGPETALGVASRIGAALAEPFSLDGLSVHVGASVGVAVFPEHAADAGELLQRADVAMYQAKQARTGHALYDPSRDLHSRDLLALAGELRRALAEDEFVVFYQPKADLVTGRIEAVEALVRWHHPDRGLLAPGQFMGIVDQSGLDRPLTLYVLDAALAQAADWARASRDLRVAVNVTASDLMEARFPEQVRAALARHGVPAQRLQLEITEDTFMTDPDRVLDVLARLSECGVGLSLDDYGTGLSSLAYLKRLPISELKIDRGFVMGMTAGSDDATIVRSTIQLAHSLGLTVTAEGVETDAAWAELRAMGCELAQGYLLSRPRPAGDLDAVLDAGYPGPADGGRAYADPVRA